MNIRPRKFALLGLGAGIAAALAPSAKAQMHHVDAPERVTRAVGVYEWTGELSKPTAARFVPVSLYINGHFEDAGLYLAQPVPFALEPGDVYALEHSGEPEGLLDVDYAKRVVDGNALADDNPVGAWYAFGKFTPEIAPREPHLNASRHLPTIHASAGPNTPAGAKIPGSGDGDDSRPHMIRRDSTGQSTPQNSGSPSGSQTGSNSPSTTSAGSSPSSNSSSNSGSSTTASTSTDNSDDIDRPTLRRRDPSQDAERRREYGTRANQSSVIAAGPPLGEDPDAPILGHRKAEDQGTPELTGLPADMHQAVAVSDAAHNDNHPFAREWDNAQERADTLAAMAALAKPRVEAYLAENNLVPSATPLATAAAGQATSPAPATAAAASSQAGGPPRLQRGIPTEYKHPAPATNKPAASAASARRSGTAAHRTTRGAAKAAAPAPPLKLEQQTISGFTLSYGGLPTFVYTAAASVAPAKTATGAAPGTNPTAFVTVVAQRLPSGNLQVALSAVTDSAHLDRSPRLRLIDAVDPDDSHRASLLFELRGTSSRQFALYRLTSEEAEQTFTTASIE